MGMNEKPHVFPMKMAYTANPQGCDYDGGTKDQTRRQGDFLLRPTLFSETSWGTALEIEKGKAILVFYRRSNYWKESKKLWWLMVMAAVLRCSTRWIIGDQKWLEGLQTNPTEELASDMTQSNSVGISGSTNIPGWHCFSDLKRRNLWLPSNIKIHILGMLNKQKNGVTTKITTKIHFKMKCFIVTFWKYSHFLKNSPLAMKHGLPKSPPLGAQWVRGFPGKAWLTVGWFDRIYPYL